MQRDEALAALAQLRRELMPEALPPLRTLALQGREWTQLRLAQRLAPAPGPTTAVPLGPLHAQALLPRALAYLQAQAPDYLQRLLTHSDALALLEPLAPAPKKAAATSAASAAGRKAPRAPSHR